MAKGQILLLFIYVDLNLENTIDVTTLNTFVVTLMSAFTIIIPIGLDQAGTGKL